MYRLSATFFLFAALAGMLAWFSDTTAATELALLATASALVLGVLFVLLELREISGRREESCPPPKA